MESDAHHHCRRCRRRRRYRKFGLLVLVKFWKWIFFTVWDLLTSMMIERSDTVSVGTKARVSMNPQATKSNQSASNCQLNAELNEQTRQTKSGQGSMAGLCEA